VIGRLRRLRDEWRLSAVTLGQPVFPLAVLFGLNAVDELDRTAFAVLLPDIRDHFGLSDAAALSLVAATTVAVLLIEVPLSFFCDRRNRVRIATIGATTWALFSFGTGLAVSVALLVLARIGAGAGRAVVTPTHSSLLSDWYEPASRVKVFAFHRLANSVGQIVGPAVAGWSPTSSASGGRSSCSPPPPSSSWCSASGCGNRSGAPTSAGLRGPTRRSPPSRTSPSGRGRP